MQYVFSVQIIHPNGDLASDVDKLIHLPINFINVQVSIETRAWTPFGDDCELFTEKAADKEENVLMSSGFQYCYLFSNLVPVYLNFLLNFHVY